MCNEKKPATEQEIKDVLLEVLISKHFSPGERVPLKEVAEKVGCSVEEVRLVARPFVEKYLDERTRSEFLRKHLIAKYL